MPNLLSLIIGTLADVEPDVVYYYLSGEDKTEAAYFQPVGFDSSSISLASVAFLVGSVCLGC